MGRLFFIITLIFLSACSSDYTAKKYFNESTETEFLLSIMAYIAKPAPGATSVTRCNPEFMLYYQGEAHKFDLVSFKPEEDSSAYFLIYKEVPGFRKNFIGIGGKVKLNNSGVASFEELFNTPKMERRELSEKSHVLFKEMVVSGNVNRYIGDYSWIDFPDSNVVYDTKNMKWKYVNSPGGALASE